MVVKKNEPMNLEWPPSEPKCGAQISYSRPQFEKTLNCMQRQKSAESQNPLQPGIERSQALSEPLFLESCTAYLLASYIRRFAKFSGELLLLTFDVIRFQKSKQSSERIHRDDAYAAEFDIFKEIQQAN